MNVLKQAIWLLILILPLTSCGGEDRDAPVFDNPFDPDNPETHGEPFHLKVEIEGRQSVLTWEKPSTDFDYYIIYRRVGNGDLMELAVVPKEAASYTDSDIEREYRHDYQICVVRRGKHSSFSPLTTDPQVYPNHRPTVTSIRPDITVDYVTISWTATDDDGTVTGYAYRLDEGAWSEFIPETSHTFSDLIVGRHTIEVKAKDNIGDEGLTKKETFSFYNTQIAFVSKRDGRSEIYLMNANGRNETRLTNSGGAYPSWSPDGRKIVFESFDGIYVMDADGRNPKQLTKSVFDHAPSWSPDGTQIAFESFSDIYVMNADGTNRTQLTENSFDHAPSWSPDGKNIVFESSGDIYVMDANGRNKTRFTNSDGAYPSWSPDGKNIVFVSSGDIYVMDADGRNETRLTNSGGWSPSWSPDGKKIVFVSNRDGNSEIYKMNVDGTSQTWLTDNPAADFDPSWSPFIK